MTKSAAKAHELVGMIERGELRLLELESYKAFLSERRKLIAECLNCFLVQDCVST